MAFLGIGASHNSSSSNANTNENSTSTSTPNAPQWLQDAWTKLFASGAAIGDQPASTYVAGPSNLQQLAFGQAPSVGQQGRALIGDAAAAAKAVPTAANTIGGATVTAPTMVSNTNARAMQGALDPTTAESQLLSGHPDNPYLSDQLKGAIGQSMIGYGDAVDAADKSLSRTVLPAIRSGAIASGGYGGSRQGIAEGVAIGDRNAQLDRNARDLGINAEAVGSNLIGNAYEAAQNRKAATASELNAQGVATATGNADRQQQANLTQAGLTQGAQTYNANANDTAASRALSSAGLVGSLGTASGANDRANLGVIGDLGGTQQTLDQAQAQAPMTLDEWLAQLYGSAPTSAFVGNTTNSSGTSNTATKGSSTGISVSAGIGSK